MQGYDVIVTGVGSMGAAACAHLAQRGVKVLGLEQFTIPHGRGSHHGRARMIRQAYFEHPDYVPLLRRGYELWEELEREFPGVFYETGGVYLGPPEGEIVKGSLAAAREHGLQHELLDHGEVGARFPQFRVPGDFAGFYEDRAGFLVPERAVAAHAARARAHGAVLMENEELREWRAGEDGVTVTTAVGSYEAERLVITAGAWSGEVLRGLGVELQVTRQVQAWFAPREAEGFALGRFPCWFIETDPPFGHYGFPVVEPGSGLKIALHKAGEPVGPEEVARGVEVPREEEVSELQAVLAEHLPGAAGECLEAKTCLYTNSPDGHFIVDRHPEHERVTLAAGFSGHGFKFSSVMGEVLADLAMEGRAGLPVGFLRVGRFG